MKKLQKRALVWLLTIAMLIPMLQAAAIPGLAAITEGNFGMMDMSLLEGLMAPAEKATINTENDGGIRFATNINIKKYEALKVFCKENLIKGLTMGTLIAPVDYVKEAGEFSAAKLSALSHKTSYLDIKCNNEEFYDGAQSVAAGYDKQFVASLVNIKLNNRERDFAAIGYIQLTLFTGTLYTIYSYDNQNMALVEKYAANLAEVATDALEQDTWSDEERAMISDLATEEEKLQVTSDTVSDVRVTRNQLFFTYRTKNGKPFYNRITYNGANGWRLQSNLNSYNHFKDISAGQSLAMYLGEGFHDVNTPLTVTQKDGQLVISAQGAETSAVLSYDTFGIDFCNAEGEALYNVNEIKVLKSTGKINLNGKMNATEAVYGGGETFTASNKRGQTLSLYISDAYNAGGTYVAVPLFSTSRGGGMFVNRYEPMTVVFPQKDTAGNWTLQVDSELVDCYFYATGEISDVLQGYTNITGHASLPEEWAQGYLVCRYAPDFKKLTDINGNTEGVYWCETLPGNYTYTPHQPLTQAAVDALNETKEAVSASIQSKDGKTTYYTFIKEKDDVDDKGNIIKKGNFYFRTENTLGVKYYYSFDELPNKDECYYDNQTKVSLAENPNDLCHKKTVSSGSSIYHYIIEDEGQDFNYNGVIDEKPYFLRVGSRGGPGGAGIIYIVESLIEAGMSPTGVILEGIDWYDAAKNVSTWGKLKTVSDYLHGKNIKMLVYSSLGRAAGDMASGFKSEYQLSAKIWGYDVSKGQKTDEVIKSKITAIPKSDQTDNPDTTSDGTQIYLDITNPAAVKWYMDTVWDVALDLGIDGVKIDFCESVPNEGYYKTIGGYLEYNWYDPSVFESLEVHHAYPSYFVSLFYKTMEEKAAKRDGDTGFVVLTRGGGIGTQRNPYYWAGDQSRTFRNLSTQLAAVINSGISGIPFMTYDMAGYAYEGSSYHYYGGQVQTVSDGKTSFYLADQRAAEEYESEIFVRALQFTTFGNMIQTHGYVRHLYQMTAEAQQISALYSALHEELADYLQKLSKIACDTGLPMIRHMILEYQNDAKVADINDQFMYGDALLLAPILTCNTKTNEIGKTVLDYASAVTRKVYLPAGEWIDLNTGETIVSTGMEIEVSANLAKIPAYLNTASEDYEMLKAIFEGQTWSQIKALANEQ